MALPAPTFSVAALDDLARREGRSLQSLATRLVRDSSEASDLVQDAYERALRRGQKLERTELRPWMTTVIRNLFVDRCRRQRARARALAALRLCRDVLCQEADEETPDWTLITYEDVTAALQKLEAPFRDVFELHARDMSLQQVATALGIPVATAGTRLFRARRKLRVALMTISSERSAGP
jgi:RNA polymerase sigma-70 factor (ECF subfamily)